MSSIWRRLLLSVSALLALASPAAAADCGALVADFKTAIADKVQIHEPTPFDSYAPIDLKEKGKGPDPLTTGVIGMAAGAAIGAGVIMAKKLPDGPEKGDDHGKTE